MATLKCRTIKLEKDAATHTAILKIYETETEILHVSIMTMPGISYDCLVGFRHVLHGFQINEMNGGSTIINSQTYHNKPNNGDGTTSQSTRHNNTVDMVRQCSTLQDMQAHSTTQPN